MTPTNFWSKGVKNKLTLEIYEKFIAPFVQYMLIRDKKYSAQGYVDAFFHSLDRKIITVKTTNSFKLPGKYVKVYHKQIDGYGNRDIKKDTKIIIRHDKTFPDRYDLEIGEEWFTLNEIQFNVVKKYFKEI